MKILRLRVMLAIGVIFILAISVCSAAGKVLNSSDIVVLHIPSEQQIKIGETLEWNDQNVQVYYEQKRVISLTVYSEEYLTSRGVKVGDTLGTIERLYGESARFGENDNYKWLTYYYESQQNSFKMHFYLDKETETIIAINLNLYPVSSPPRILQSKK